MGEVGGKEIRLEIFCNVGQYFIFFRNTMKYVKSSFALRNPIFAIPRFNFLKDLLPYF